MIKALLLLVFCNLAVISAISAKKPAPLEYVQPFTECGEVFTNSTGEVTSPGYPDNYPNSVSSCGYLITRPVGRTVLLFFDFIDVEDSYDFVNVYDGKDTSSPSIGELTGSYNDYTIESTRNNMYITFTSDYSNSASGFQATWTTCEEVFTSSKGEITSPGYPDLYPSSVDGCGYLITVPEGTVLLFFNFYELESNYDYVNIYDGTNSLSPRIAEITGSSSYNQYILSFESTGNNMYLKFQSDSSISKLGFRATWTTCGEVFTTNTGEITSPGYPGIYPYVSQCFYRITVPESRAVLLTFDFIDLGGGDYIDILDMVMGIITGSFNNLAVRSTGNIMKISFRSSYNRDKLGFRATWKTVCGNRQRGPSGTITSPGYPSTYPNNTNACNTIDAEGGTIIQLNFTKLLTVVDVDFVSVYDGEDDTAPLLGRYSGNADGTVLTSTSNVLTVILTSETNTSDGNGYSADYITLPRAKPLTSIFN